MKLDQKEAKSILTKLRDGTPPLKFAYEMMVGRKAELASIRADLDLVAEGQGRLRFVVADNGGGKSHFLAIIRHAAVDDGFVVMHAQFAQDKMFAAQGRGRQLYRDLINNMITKTSKTAALPAILEKFISAAKEQVKSRKITLDEALEERYSHISGLPYGPDFLAVIKCYISAWQAKDRDRQKAALKWMRGEYKNMGDAYKDLRVKVIIEDARIYDALKIVGAICKEAGYKGVMVQIDELHAIENVQSRGVRNSNYDTISNYYNLLSLEQQHGFLLVMGCTPKVLTDEDRGLYSNSSLLSRLKKSAYDKDNHNGAVIELQPHTSEEYKTMLSSIVEVFAASHGTDMGVNEHHLDAFIANGSKVLGGAQSLKTRQFIKDFVSFLTTLHDEGAALTPEILLSRPIHQKSHTSAKSAPTAPRKASAQDLADLEDA